jgi:hypothetical protein
VAQENLCESKVPYKGGHLKEPEDSPHKESVPRGEPFAKNSIAVNEHRYLESHHCDGVRPVLDRNTRGLCLFLLHHTQNFLGSFGSRGVEMGSRSVLS